MFFRVLGCCLESHTVESQYSDSDLPCTLYEGFVFLSTYNNKKFVHGFKKGKDEL